MTDDHRLQVAIIDYGMGNLFSVKRACEYVGLRASITCDMDEILSAAAAILPGVGAFEDAMNSLRSLDLVTTLNEFVASSRPLMGICLGMQLLMSQSHEFGIHEGLSFVPGKTVRLERASNADVPVKVPQVGWNSLISAGKDSVSWTRTMLQGLTDGVFMYFCHSFVTEPEDKDVIVATTRYGGNEFCSVLQAGNIFACQFHPERSGINGLEIYRNLAGRLLHDHTRRN